MFCNDILFELVLVRLKDDRRRGEFVALFGQYKHVCTKWSFAVSILCLVHHAVRLWCSPRRWPCVATNPVQIRWKSHVSFPHSWGRRASLEKTLSLVMSPGLVIIYFLGCPIVLSRLKFLEKPYYCVWGRAKTPSWGCSLFKKNGHVRDMA